MEEKIKKGKTTIQVGMDTKCFLDKLKIIDQEPYDAVLQRIKKVLDKCEEGYDSILKTKISERIEAVHKGLVLSTKELKEELFGEKKNEIRKNLGRTHTKRLD